MILGVGKILMIFSLTWIGLWFILILMSDKKIYGPDIYKRNEHGLLENADYAFNEDGSIDWRAMIKPEFLYPNKGWFEARNKPVPRINRGFE